METTMDEHRALDVIFSDDTRPADAVYRVRQTLLDWGLDGLTEAVCLVLVELLANATAHAGGATALCMELDGSLWVEVYDSSDMLPGILDGDANCGLKVVEKLASDWGTIAFSDEKCVFAEFWVTQ